MSHRRNRDEFLCDGGVCPACAGVIVGDRLQWVCLDCHAFWRLAIHPDADLGRRGFPAADTARAAGSGGG